MPSKTDKAIALVAGLAAIDSIVVPCITHGKTLHELVGVSPKEIKTDQIINVVEQAYTLLTAGYFSLKEYYNRKKQNYLSPENGAI